MNELQIFKSKEFGEIRTVIIEDEPWFVGKEVASALGYKDTSDALKKHVAKEDKLTRCFADSGQKRQMYIVNNSFVEYATGKGQVYFINKFLNTEKGEAV